MTVPDTVTHLAGIDARYDTRVRQRCAWCGAVLIDVDLDLIGVADDGPTVDESPYPTWPAGQLVRTVGAMSTVVIPETGETHDDYVAPDDACMRIDPEVTA